MWKWRIDCFTQVTQLFSSPERVASFQPSGSGNDVWLEKMSDTGTCSARAVKKADSKLNCFELESRWQRVGREEALQWIRFYLLCLLPILGRFYSKSRSDTQALRGKLYSLKDKFVTILFSHLSSWVEKQICSLSTFRIIIPVNLVKICF